MGIIWNQNYQRSCSYNQLKQKNSEKLRKKLVSMFLGACYFIKNRLRNRRLDVFCRKGVFRNFLRPATLLKKRLWHRCFPEIYKNTFFYRTLRWLLLHRISLIFDKFKNSSCLLCTKILVQHFLDGCVIAFQLLILFFYYSFQNSNDWSKVLSRV